MACSARGRDQVSRDVDTDDRGSTPRDRPRGPAGSGRQVENTLTGLGIEAQDAMLYGVGNAAADLVVGSVLPQLHTEAGLSL